MNKNTTYFTIAIFVVLAIIFWGAFNSFFKECNISDNFAVVKETGLTVTNKEEAYLAFEQSPVTEYLRNYEIMYESITLPGGQEINTWNYKVGRNLRVLYAVSEEGIIYANSECE